MDTIQPCTSLHSHFIQSHISRVHVCLAVTCHLHLWQNDRGLLRATAVTRGWNGYRNKSAQKVDPGEEKFPCHSFGDSNLQLASDQESDALTTELSLPTVDSGEKKISCCTGEWSLHYLCTGTIMLNQLSCIPST